jgi:hypothetical protein
LADVTDTAIYVAVGAYAVPKMADLALSFFKGSVTRNIEAADKAQEAVVADVKRLDRELLLLKGAHDAHKEAVNTALGSIDGRLLSLDKRIAEQGKSYEEKIETGFKKLEIEVNRKLAQVVAELDGRRSRARVR